MEYFYREMRRKTGWLMEDGEPVGGSWNYDAQNRKALPKGLETPRRRRFEPDETTSEVMDLVEERFGDHFGDLSTFGWPVTREQALQALDDFVDNALPDFGDYQDAMRGGEDFLFHALLSPCLNLGLLEPGEVCEAVLEAHADGRAPLAATEGFIRQVLGWREFVRHVHEHTDGFRSLPGAPQSTTAAIPGDAGWSCWTGEDWPRVAVSDEPDGGACPSLLGADRPLPRAFWPDRHPARCWRRPSGTVASRPKQSGWSLLPVIPETSTCRSSITTSGSKTRVSLRATNMVTCAT